MNTVTYKVVKGINPSPIERKIVRIFRKENISYRREVEFDGLVNPKTNRKLRCDFYLPDHNLILEYDGRGFHDSADVKYRGSLKDKFAKDNQISLYRIVGGEELNCFLVDVLKMDAGRHETRRHNVQNIDNFELVKVEYWVNLSKSDPERFYDEIVHLRSKLRQFQFYNLLRRHIKAISTCTRNIHFKNDKELIISTLRST
jgi:hypothetical protein